MQSPDRREVSPGPTRGRFEFVWDILFRFIRFVAAHVTNAYATFGLLILGGAVIGVGLTYAFAVLAGKVMSGGTLPFDDRVMTFFGAHQVPWLVDTMVEITSLGTGVTVAMIVGVTCLFLWLYDYKPSAQLLIVATLGGIVLDNVLKLGFNRPRPRIFPWGTHAESSSFPSGHAMSAAVVYATVAYLATRLAKTHLGRMMIAIWAVVIIALICFSRVYLGVHYPSDVIAGVVVGLAWAAFCMVTLEASQLYARRNAPALVEGEHGP